MSIITLAARSGWESLGTAEITVQNLGQSNVELEFDTTTPSSSDGFILAPLVTWTLTPEAGETIYVRNESSDTIKLKVR